ncbi:hypothetical protein [Lentibacillus sp. CBA3610]|uniref:hypothetical protein n=1 Tax=Lentibacillus sp. CBA3610 TaxID=2518176 RepID=UPI001595DA8B|nr:hypothetical protein [Lentibacillus sp. CBA3610]QKY70207.1 hypothetical protein Len3610_11930 [Lentibacillus sp. CBA3610]
MEELNTNKKKVDDELENHESEFSESKNKIDRLNSESEEKTGKIEELQDKNASLQADVRIGVYYRFCRD